MTSNDSKRTGRRPYLSDKLPTMGAKKNWIKAKTNINQPATLTVYAAPSPVMSARRLGRTGMMIPNPTESSSAVRNTNTVASLCMLVLFASVLVIFRAWLVVSIASKANHVSDMYPRNRVQRWLVGCGKSTQTADLSGEMSNMSQAAREFVQPTGARAIYHPSLQIWTKNIFRVALRFQFCAT